MDLLVTNAGLAALVNAEQTGTESITLASIRFGSGQYTPTATQTALKSPITTLTALSGGASSAHTLHVSVEDASAATYTVYEVGVFLADGTLFAVSSQNTPIVQKAAEAIALLAVDIKLADHSAASVTVGDTNFFNPPATTDIKGVVELATDAETIAGKDAERVVTPAGLKALTSTDARRGLIEIATDAEVFAGADNARALTPKNLLAAFVKAHGASGFQRLPNGFIVQWGRARIANGDTGTAIVFPTAFPTACTGVYLSSVGSLGVAYSHDTPTAGGVTVRHNGNGGAWTEWLAVGY